MTVKISPVTRSKMVNNDNLEGRPGGELCAQQAEGASGVSGRPAADGFSLQDGHVDAFPGQVIGDRATDHTGADDNYVGILRQNIALQWEFLGFSSWAARVSIGMR